MKMQLNSKLSSMNIDEHLAQMFGAPEQTITMVAIDMLEPYPDQRFRMYTEAKIAEMCESITRVGILSPINVRRLPEQPGIYQILSGRNRVESAKRCGLSEVPCIVLDVDDDAAQWIVATANLSQRSELLPSEKAYGYRMQLDAENRQGARTDLTSSNSWTKSRSDMEIAAVVQQSRSTVHMYARLTKLIEPLLTYVDEKRIPVTAGYELAGLTISQQEQLMNFMKTNKISKITTDQAKLIALHSGNLHEQDLCDDFGITQKLLKPKSIALKIPSDYFPEQYRERKIKPDEELLKQIAEVIERYYTESS